MKLAIRIATILLVLFISLYGVILFASESGEVIVVTTRDSAGAAVETRLWTVEYDGDRWIRSGSPASGWYKRLLANGDVRYRLGEATHVATAVPEPAATSAINDLMQEKYGWADTTIDLVFGRDDAIAIRLVPRTTP